MEMAALLGVGVRKEQARVQLLAIKYLWGSLSCFSDSGTIRGLLKKPPCTRFCVNSALELASGHQIKS